MGQYDVGNKVHREFLYHRRAQREPIMPALYEALAGLTHGWAANGPPSPNTASKRA
jgi:hypothetical protein